MEKIPNYPEFSYFYELDDSAVKYDHEGLYKAYLKGIVEYPTMDGYKTMIKSSSKIINILVFNSQNNQGDISIFYKNIAVDIKDFSSIDNQDKLKTLIELFTINSITQQSYHIGVDDTLLKKGWCVSN